MNGWFKTYRKLLNWEWFRDPYTSHFWQYCLLKANFSPTEYKGIKIKRGEFLESMSKMSEETGLTIQNIRTAIVHIKSTREITCKSTRYGMLIHVVKYSIYQDKPNLTNTQTNTISNNEVTRPLYTEEDKEIKEDIRISSSNNLYKSKNTKNINRNKEKMMTMNNIPTLKEVKEYFKQNDMKSDPKEFYKYNQEFDWKDKNGNPIKSWKRAAKGWERSFIKYGARHSANHKKVPVPDFMKKPPKVDLDDLPF